jgi:hypothetical protein
MLPTGAADSVSSDLIRFLTFFIWLEVGKSMPEEAANTFDLNFDQIAARSLIKRFYLLVLPFLVLA